MRSKIFIFSCRSGNKNHLVQQNASLAPENRPNLLLNGMDISDPPIVCIQERQMGFCKGWSLCTQLGWSTHRLFQQGESSRESSSSAVVRLRRSRARSLIVKIILGIKKPALLHLPAGGKSGLVLHHRLWQTWVLRCSWGEFWEVELPMQPWA